MARVVQGLGAAAARIVAWRSSAIFFWGRDMARLVMAVQALAFALLFASISSIQQFTEVSFGRADEFPYWFARIALAAEAVVTLALLLGRPALGSKLCYLFYVAGDRLLPARAASWQSRRTRDEAFDGTPVPLMIGALVRVVVSLWLMRAVQAEECMRG